jgi:hypothetical protein
MLGYISAEGRGTSDWLLFDLAESLAAEGLRLAGAVQANVERREGNPCDMDLHVLARGEVVKISQDLGPGARGCRLHPGELERAVGEVLAALDEGVADLVIVNKFGKQEALHGGGFRTVFASAMERGLPVLTAVTPGQLPAFLEFAGDLAEQVEATPGALRAWVVAALSAAKAA